MQSANRAFSRRRARHRVVAAHHARRAAGLRQGGRRGFNPAGAGLGYRDALKTSPRHIRMHTLYTCEKNETIEAKGIALMPRAQRLPAFTERDIDQMAASAREAADFLKALAHETRLHILCQLVDGEKHVSELEQALDIRQSTVSQQLARLRLEGLVAFRREGKQVFYSIADDDVRKIIKVLVDIFCKR
jgi:DNA-binding transcriptional ArsR family regulator